MSTSRMELRRVTKDPIRKSFPTDLLQSSRRTINDKQFAELFKLFFSAVDHELGNSLFGVIGLTELGKNKELARVAGDIYHTYKRIGILQTLALGSRQEYSLTKFFSPQEIKKLRIGDSQSSADIEAVKEIGLQEVRKFRALLVELKDLYSNLPPTEYPEDKLGPSMVQSLKFGLLLSNCLEKLMLGSLDLDAQLMTDQGCGMPTEIMGRLNAGLPTTTKEEPGKHGIGFQYCRELAEKMGGKLYIKESSLGVGTTVTLELRLA